MKEMPSRDSGAKRESIGTKLRTDLVPYELVLLAAIGLEYGAEKYGARNFEKGLNTSDLLMSIERHTRAMMDGEEMDEESGLPHIALLSSSIAMFSYSWMQGRLQDDMREPKNALRSIGDLSRAAQSILNSRSPANG